MTYQNPKGDLTRGSITKHLIRMGGPMTWGIFAIISFQLADIFFVSLLGTAPLAALGFVMPVTMAMFSLILGLIIAMSSVLSREIGAGNTDRVIRITTHGIVFAALFGLALGITGLALMEPLFRALGASEEMMPMIRDYMTVIFAGTVFLAIPVNCNAAMRAGGDTMTPALVMTIVSVLNIVLDPVLIFGWGPVPAMGIQGAAIATIIADIVASCTGLFILTRRHMVRFRPFYPGKFGDSLKRLLFIAVPAGLTNTITPVTNAVIVSLLASYGAEHVAAYGIVSRVEAFAFVAVMGVAGGMAPILGQNWGAGNYERVHKTLHKAFRFSIGWTFFVALVLGVFARQIAGLFSGEAVVIETASLYFWIVPVTYAAGNLVQGWSSAFNALGHPHRSALMILGKYIAIQIPLAVAGGHFWGVPGIFGAIAMANFFVGTGLHIWNWRVCRHMEEKRKEAAAVASS